MRALRRRRARHLYSCVAAPTVSTNTAIPHAIIISVEPAAPPPPPAALPPSPPAALEAGGDGEGALELVVLEVVVGAGDDEDDGASAGRFRSSRAWQAAIIRSYLTVASTAAVSLARSMIVPSFSWAPAVASVAAAIAYI